MHDTSNFRRGGQVKVFQKITEGKRDRIVSFVGVIISIKGKDDNRMLTVRQTLDGVEVDRIFPVSSPTLTKIEAVEEKKKAPVQKAKAKPRRKAAKKK